MALKDSVADKLEWGDGGLDGNRYMSWIISTSSYPKGELEVKMKEVFKRLVFQ